MVQNCFANEAAGNAIRSHGMQSQAASSWLLPPWNTRCQRERHHISATAEGWFNAEDNFGQRG